MSHIDRPVPAERPARKPWQAPRVSRLDAGHAENRLQGVVRDSQLALGS